MLLTHTCTNIIIIDNIIIIFNGKLMTNIIRSGCAQLNNYIITPVVRITNYIKNVVIDIINKLANYFFSSKQQDHRPNPQEEPNLREQEPHLLG